MGYDLHITRKVCRNDPIGPSISAEEWLTVLADGTIIHVDPHDNGSLGCVRIPTEDGGEHEFAYIASG